MLNVTVELATGYGVTTADEETGDGSETGGTEVVTAGAVEETGYETVHPPGQLVIVRVVASVAV